MAHANTAQLISAWSAMDDRDLMILRKMATVLIGGTVFTEPLDLIHEAFHRCLEGRRNWPMEVRFSVFLGNVMRSIAESERRGAKRRAGARVDFDVFLESMQQQAAAPSAEEEAIASEELRIGREAADALRAKLKGDEAGRKVLSGIVAGLSPKEMRESFHMDAQAFDAAVKRVLRRARQCAMH